MLWQIFKKITTIENMLRDAFLQNFKATFVWSWRILKNHLYFLQQILFSNITFLGYPKVYRLSTKTFNFPSGIWYSPPLERVLNNPARSVISVIDGEIRYTFHALVLLEVKGRRVFHRYGQTGIEVGMIAGERHGTYMLALFD